MARLTFTLRIAAVVIASPAILLCIVLASFLHPIESIRHPLRRPRRLWMNVGDWVRGIPVGYSYWERYQAPAMLDQIAVHHHHHHHEDSAS
jgi:hypothetical protein